MFFIYFSYNSCYNVQNDRKGGGIPMENRTGRTIGLILANASSSFTTAFMDLFQQELYQKDYKLVIGLTNHDLEKERF